MGPELGHELRRHSLLRAVEESVAVGLEGNAKGLDLGEEGLSVHGTSSQVSPASSTDWL